MTAPRRARSVSSGVMISLLGVLFFAIYLFYLRLNEAYLQGPVWLLPLGLLLVAVLSAALVYGGYWVRTSDFDAEQGWEVTIWLFAGLIAALALTFWPIFYQRIVGVTIEDPVFILLVSSGLGANAGIVAGISQVRSERQFQRVEHARDSLEFLNRLLRHNVLNAISIIQGNAELLVERADCEETTERARTIQRQSQQIDTLIQNTKILVHRIEGEFEPESVDLIAVLAEQLDVARETHEEAVIESTLPSGVTVRADPLISAIVENLVTNAIDHNDQETPKVVVTLETRDDAAVLRIADNGPSVQGKDREELVSPGQHGDQGLGLYLVDTLVTQYDGSLSFDDNEPRGTVVTVELPLA
jgi:signal transduction histidine kinase